MPLELEERGGGGRREGRKDGQAANISIEVNQSLV